jgi:hypothetical protein
MPGELHRRWLRLCLGDMPPVVFTRREETPPKQISQVVDWTESLLSKPNIPRARAAYYALWAGGLRQSDSTSDTVHRYAGSFGGCHQRCGLSQNTSRNGSIHSLLRYLLVPIFPFATPTSTCRSRFTICSAVCFFPRPLNSSSCSSFIASQLVQKVPGIPRSRNRISYGFLCDNSVAEWRD